MKNARVTLCAFAKISTVIVTGLFLASPAIAQASEYRISPGETVEISVASIRDMKLRAIVQTDGTISINGVGSMMAAGLTPAAFQTQLELLLPTKLFRERGDDGQIKTYIVEPGDISSSVVAYRPVYITGDVLSPGEQPYLPELTARQAVAVSGGYSQIRGKLSKDGADPLDLQQNYQSLWADFLKSHYHRVRLEAELKGETNFEMRPPAGSPLTAALPAAIADNELQILQIAIQDATKERDFYKAAIVAAGEQIDTLTAREKVEAAGEKADEQELAKVTQLFKNGNLTNDRVAEIRRSLLLTSSRRLGTLVELMKVRSQRAEYERQIEKAANTDKIKLLDDLSNTNVLLASLEAKLSAVGAKLQLQSVVTSAEPAATDLVQPRLTIRRKQGVRWQQIAADGDTEVLPGDVLEVSLCRDAEMGSPACPNMKIDLQTTNATAKN